MITKVKHFPAVIVICGPPASGKTTTSQQLRNCFEHAIAIEVDAIVDMCGSQFIPPIKRLAHLGAQELAKFYLQHGWTVIVDELFIRSEYLDVWRHLATNQSVPFFVFQLTAQTNDLIKRNQSREKVLDQDRLAFLIPMCTGKIENANIINTSVIDENEVVNKIIDILYPKEVQS